MSLIKRPWIILSVILTLVWVPCSGRGAVEKNPGLEVGITPDAIMRRVRDTLPGKPVLIIGQLRCGPLWEGFDRSYHVEMRMDMSRTPMSAEYILRDQFGDVTEQLLMTRNSVEDVALQYRRGSESITPDLGGHILDTDITWGDISLAFLWWPDACLVGKDTFRGRDCLVLDLAPGKLSDPPETRRLWVDEKIYAFLQMEVRVSGIPVRRLIARSFKKIGGHWMVKDMEMRSLTRSHRTLLRVEEMREFD